MNRTLHICLTACWLATAPVAAEEPSLLPMSEQGLVILRNGQTLEGKISRVGDFYHIALSTGEIRLKAADVDLVCRDLEEGYQRKRAALPFDTAVEHLRLAHWCQRKGLVDHAAEEIALAKRLEPNHPMMALVEQRQRGMAQESAPSGPAVMPTDGGLPQEDLDRTVRELPQGTVETYARTIQPMLMNNCLVSGCHCGDSKSKLELLRVPFGQPAGRRLTQRNLYETLQWLDADRPEQSPLLKAARSAHGGLKQPAFSSQPWLEQRLVDWVYGACQGQAVASLAKAREAKPREPSRLPIVDTAVKPVSHVESVERVAPECDERPMSTALILMPPKATPKPRSPEAAPPAPAVVTPSDFDAVGGEPVSKPEIINRSVGRVMPEMPFAPADPFDARAFNRRYFPEKDAAPASSEPASFVQPLKRGE